MLGVLLLAASLAGCAHTPAPVSQEPSAPAPVPQEPSAPAPADPEQTRAKGAPSRLTLRVVDGEGKPIPGARVEVGARRREPPSRVLTTGPDGEVSFDGSGSLATFQAPGYCGEERELFRLPPGEHQLRQVRLRPARTLAGRLVDERGQPVPHARLEAHLRYHEVFRVSGTSDAQGRFSLSGLCAGPVEVWASAKGLPDLYTQASVPGDDVVLTFPSFAKLTVKVRDEHGRPLPQAPVRVEGMSVSTQATQRSDAEGEARFDALPPGAFHVSVTLQRSHESTFTTSAQVEVASGQEGALEVSFEGFRFRAPLSGQVVDPNGQPLFAAIITASVDAPLMRKSPDEVWEAQEGLTSSSPQGRFSLPALREGPLTLHVDRMKCCPAQSFPVPPEDREVTLRLKPYQLAFEGRVTRPDGAPVSLFAINGAWRESPQGRFEYTAPEGSQPPRLVIEAHGFEPRSVSVEQPRADRPAVLPDIVLTPLSPAERKPALRTVRGRVVAEDGRTPVAGVRVTRLDEEAVAEGSDSYTRGHAETDADGRFVMENVPALPQRFLVMHSPEGVVLQPVAPGEDDITLRLSRGADITGVVTDAQGRPVPEAVVVADCAFPWDGAFTHTDPEGRYVLRGLGPHACAIDGWVPVNAQVYAELTPSWLTFSPREVQVPDSGTLRVDLAARSGSASLQVDQRLTGESARVYVLEGDVPMPSSIRQLKDLGRRALRQDFALQDESRMAFPWMYARGYEYVHLPPGRYTVFGSKLEGNHSGGGHVLRLPVDLTGGPEPTRIRVELSGQEPFLPP